MILISIIVIGLSGVLEMWSKSHVWQLEEYRNHCFKISQIFRHSFETLYFVSKSSNSFNANDQSD